MSYATSIYRSRRLEMIFGERASRETLTWAHLEALTTALVPEAEDLDFKRDLYGNSDKDRRALTTDAAAMANTQGGIIVLGIGENTQA
ncbi:ATP-binding protein [Streptosporangiaceae bacterium NEAU-GS5]|nr:ATP-binding protein [Streptosporangiaceae bacterium NEAU-GS5]